MKRITIKDIAREAGTSYVTVSHYLNKRGKKFSDQTAIRIEEAIQKLGYIPHRAARRLASHRSYTIGVVLPPAPFSTPASALLAGNPFYNEFVAGVQTQAWKYDYDVLTRGFSTPGDLFEWIISYEIDGVILFDSSIASGLELESRRRNISLDTVLVGLDTTLNSLHSRVIIDEREAFAQATRHLIQHGHKNIAIATGDFTVSRVNAERLDGYKKAMREAGFSVKPSFILVDEVSLEGGKRIGEKLLSFVSKRQVSAVVCVADIVAAGIYKSFQRVGKRIPRDLSIVGFDDLFLSTLLEPELTTVRQDVAGRGARCVQVIEDFYHGKQTPQVVLPTTLVVRSSVAFFPSKRSKE